MTVAIYCGPLYFAAKNISPGILSLQKGVPLRHMGPIQFLLGERGVYANHFVSTAITKYTEKNIVSYRGMLISELNHNRRLGVEFEFAIPQIGSSDGSDVRRVLADILTSNGVTAISRSYSQRPVPPGCYVVIEYDSSVTGESRYSGIRWNSVELKTRILFGIEDWEAIVPKALAICRYLGGRVNSSTGMHVHIELSEVTSNPVVIRSLYNLIHRYENIIFSLVAPSRRRNHYALRLPDRPGMLRKCRTLPCFRRSLSALPRNSGMNWTHLWGRSPRIEYRYHGGTLDVEKARHWTRFLLRLTDHACIRTCKASPAQLPSNRQSFNKMATTLGLKVNSRVYAKVSPELRETGRYLLKRWKHFQTECATTQES